MGLAIGNWEQRGFSPMAVDIGSQWVNRLCLLCSKSEGESLKISKKDFAALYLH